MYYIYLIYSNSADKYYIGHSSDPWKRLEQHNNNEPDKFTGKYKPWDLKAVFQISERKGDADKIEKFIKRQKSRKLILQLIETDFIPNGVLVQLVRVPHVRN